jgi:Putative addiction module component
MTELLGLPEPERVDLVQRLLESLREGAVSDDLDDDERAELHQALHRSEADLRAGRVRPASALIAELRERRTR